MRVKRELGLRLPNTTRATSLREQLMITTLRNVRMQGHTYVELREDEKRMIFFCVLCLSPCYGDSVLYQHLKGKIHSERLVTAKKTLMKPNPWPFNDSVYFFHESSEEVKELPASNADKIRLLEKSLEIDDDDNNSLAIVAHGDYTQPGGDERDFSGGLGSDLFDSDGDRSGHDQDLDGNGTAYDLVIPGVLHKEEICELYVRFIGVGQIAARVFEKDGSLCRMWCEWLGKKGGSGNEDQQHDFSIVTFPYNYDLGRKGLLNDVRYLLLSSSQQLTEGVNKKRKKSFSDSEDISESLINQYDSSGEETMSSNSSSSKLLLGGCDDQILQPGLASNRTLRKQMRKQQHVAAEKTCDICQHKLLPGKDVATLLNMKTGRIACSSRNVNGAFHVYHVSCLVHWVILCESEIHNKPMVLPEVKHTSRSKTGGRKRKSEQRGGTQSSKKQIYSVFCPECQGTGMNIHGGELEKPTVSINEMFRYKMKICDARRAWMKSPEELQNCSTGFHFPSQFEEATQEMIVSSLKMLHFYRADE